METGGAKAGIQKSSSRRIHMKTRHYPALCVLAVICLVSACTPEKPLSESARKFRAQVVDDLSRLTESLEPALQKPDVGAAADHSIAEFFRTVSSAGHSGCIVAVLDTDMHYLAGRSLNPGEPGGVALDVELSNYEYLKSAFKGLEQGRIVHSTLHFRQEKIYVVAAPIRNSVRILGFVFLAFPADRFESMWRISGDEFHRLDFNPA
jgi:hypothetical protein